MNLTVTLARLSLAAAIVAALPLAGQAMMTNPDEPEAAASGGSGSSGSSGSSAAGPLLAEAQAAISAGNYDAALAPLQQAVAADSNNADAHNMLGYALRQLNRYGEAQAAYERALAIDPEHLGALEYYGELLLMVGDLGGAQERLAMLDEICYLGCDEYDALEAAIEDYMTAE